MFKKTFLVLLTIFFVGSQICLASDEPTEQKKHNTCKSPLV